MFLVEGFKHAMLATFDPTDAVLLADNLDEFKEHTSDFKVGYNERTGKTAPVARPARAPCAHDGSIILAVHVFVFRV